MQICGEFFSVGDEAAVAAEEEEAAAEADGDSLRRAK